MVPELEGAAEAKAARELPKSVEKFSKNDYVLVGLLLAGGARKWVDAEDVAVICYKLNRPAFRWARYDYPHLEAVSNAFRRIKAESGDRLLVAPSAQSSERRLTAGGLQRARALGEMLIGRSYKEPRALVHALRKKIRAGDNEPASALAARNDTVERREAQTILAFITNHPAYRAWSRDRLGELPLWQVADALQCLPDSPAAVWRERLARYQSLAAWWNRQKVHDFLEALRARIAELPEG